jgi:hypothetical protein
MEELHVSNITIIISDYRNKQRHKFNEWKKNFIPKERELRSYDGQGMFEDQLKN